MVVSVISSFRAWTTFRDGRMDGRNRGGWKGEGGSRKSRASSHGRRTEEDGFGGRDEQGGRFGRTVCETDPGAAGPAHSPLLIDAVCPLMPISRDEALYERHQGQTVQPMARIRSLSARVIIAILDPSS